MENENVKLKDFAGLLSFLRNRIRRSGSPPMAENAENSAFCLELAQEQLLSCVNRLTQGVNRLTLCWIMRCYRDHVFLRVTPITGVGRALKSKKLTPRFIGPYQILERIGEVAYRIALPPSLANLHEVFHVSQLRRYIPDPSHVVQVDDVQVRDNLTVETSPIRIEDRELKQLRGKEIALVKVAWGGPAGGNVTWELESQMKESYPELFA
ncbi:hypothetical protein KIW84_033704 [Lathyrus oleraceus]|uniref:Tf2-1-like SH3-like domain-containing protein n=1 Tax=Pisum sativum TaxID=3888 RepID=A0A9D5AYC0_PEA|nr:hypothetical protein KIW84_033704 [Pisum sativum]